MFKTNLYVFKFLYDYRNNMMDFKSWVVGQYSFKLDEVKCLEKYCTPASDQRAKCIGYFKQITFVFYGP